MKLACILIAILAQAATDEPEPAVDGYENSLQLVQAELAGQPNNLKLLDTLGHVHFRRSQFARAAKVFERCATIEPRSFNAWMGLGGAYLELGKNERAIEAFRHAIEVGQPPATIPARFRLAQLYRQEGRPQDAIAMLRTCLELSTSQKEVWLELGESLRSETRRMEPGNEREALESEGIAALEKAIVLDPKDHQPHYVLGMLHRRQGHVEQARIHLQESTKLRPLGAKPRREKKILEAEFEAATAIALAGMHRRAGRPAKVIEYADKALALVPDYTPALIAKAAVFLDADNLQGAAALYERVIEKEPRNTQALASLASIHLAAGNLEKGAALALRAGQSDPSRADVWEWLHALATQEQIHAERAEEFARNALAARPSVDNYHALAYFLYQTGRKEASIKVIDRGLAQHPGNEALLESRRVLTEAEQK
jgi:tetratricopeptide (TPR) repeat protein